VKSSNSENAVAREVFRRSEINLAIGAVCIGFAPIFVKLVDVPPTAVGFYRCALAALGLLPIYLVHWFKRRRSTHSISSGLGLFQGQLLLATAGLVFALDLTVWHRSILIVGAGIATLLANTQVFYLGMIQLVSGHEKPTMRFWLAVSLGLLGIGLIAMASIEGVAAENYGLGIFMGLCTGLIYATYITLMSRIERRIGRIDIYDKIFWVSTWTAIFLLVIALIQGESLAIDAWEFLNLSGLAAISQVAGWVLITKNLPMVPISHAGLIVLLQPVFATFLGVVILAESLTPLQWFGSALSLVAIYWGRISPRRMIADDTVKA
jgi:drug/metabolite transporter (DMT)-like permease